MLAQGAAGVVGADDGRVCHFHHVPEALVADVGDVHDHAVFVHGSHQVASKVRQPAAGHVLERAVGGMRAVAPRERHGAHAEPVEHRQHPETALQDLGVLDGEHRGDPAAVHDGLNLVRRGGDGDLVGMGVHLGEKPAKGVHGVEQMIAPIAGDVHGAVDDVDAACAQLGDIDLYLRRASPHRTPQERHGALRLRAGRRVRPGDALPIAPDVRDDGIVVGVDDEGRAVQFGG